MELDTDMLGLAESASIFHPASYSRRTRIRWNSRLAHLPNRFNKYSPLVPRFLDLSAIPHRGWTRFQGCRVL